MTNKLYVSNVPIDSTEAALRSHFAACGGVADVELVFDRRSGKPRGLAYVTMTSPAFASAALRQLDGAVFGGASLHVSDSPIRAGDRAAPKVRIVQQFRERANMTYDLDCDGAPLTLRIFPDGERWRIEARMTDAADAVVATGFGATRAEALTDVMGAWNERAALTHMRPLDGAGMCEALRNVRAI